MRNITIIGSLITTLLILCAPAWGWIEVCGIGELQWQPAVAFDGNQFLVAWTDLRELPGDPSTNIYAARVAADGSVLDTGGILIAHGPDEQMEPRVCAGPSDWLVIWQEGC